MTEADDIAWGDNPRGTYEKALDRIAELEAERDIWINAAKLACSDKEKVAAERDRLREAHERNKHQARKVAYDDRKHHCGWREVAEAMIQRSEKALEKK